MTRFVGYIAMSLDARIADVAGSVDWLQPFNDPDNDFGYADFYAAVDIIVMGRNTYDFVASQPEWSYPGRRVLVVTSRPIEDAPEGVETVSSDFDHLRAELVGKDLTVWVMGGGRTQRAALDAGMFDEIRIFVMPLVLGGGPLIFSDGHKVDAEHTDTKSWPGGVVELSYQF